MAVFTYAARYEVTAACETPLRTGGADGDTETVLRGQDGRPFLQGASLAGAMKNWLSGGAKKKTVDALFGSQKKSGHLIVSDGLFAPDADMQLRPRLRIDGESGTADKGGKFDVAHIAAGTELEFSLLWLSPAEAPEELTAVEETLSALNRGEIRLGAQKSNGFGRVRLTVKKQTYDMTCPQDRAAWAEDRFSGQSLPLSEGAKGGAVFIVRAHGDSILVKASAARQEEDGSYTGNLTEGRTPILPGSSIKGAVRSRAELIALHLGLGKAMTDEIFGRGAADGDNGKQGLVRFEDVKLSDKNRQKITRIRIDRFTGGVMRGGLFREEPLSSDVELRITIPTARGAACGLLVYALRDLGLGLYNLGSGGSIGRGYLSVSRIDMAAPDGRKARLCFDKEHRCTAEDEAGLIREWMKELEAVRA